MAQFLHKKKDSSLLYYRRRYPQDVAKVVGKSVHMQSLQTSVKREAERLSRRVSVEFDTICHEARLKCDVVRLNTQLVQGDIAEPESVANAEALALAQAEGVLAKVPGLVRLAAVRVVEEQIRDPQGWSDTIRRWKDFYSSALTAPMPSPGPQTAIEAQAFLNGIELAVQGKPLPLELALLSREPAQQGATQVQSECRTETWTELCARALDAFRHNVGSGRYKLATSRLPMVQPRTCSEHDIQEALRAWCVQRLNEVKPRTVKGQLDCMVSALRCVLPKLVTPALLELRGVMQPRGDDRESMPIQEIFQAVQAFKNRRVPAKVRNDYGGGASQFDATAVEVLAVLGLRPRELVQARTDALVTKVDTFGNSGLYFRVVIGKNRTSERLIPLSDGTRVAVHVERLREMLEWQEKNPRSLGGAVSSLGTRFKAMTGGRTLYQMRHSWKDIVMNAGVDGELRERLLGHKVPGVAAVYGAGTFLRRGLDALMLVRETIGLAK